MKIQLKYGTMTSKEFQFEAIDNIESLEVVVQRKDDSTNWFGTVGPKIKKGDYYFLITGLTASGKEFSRAYLQDSDVSFKIE